jgi:hypothetical protein
VFARSLLAIEIVANNALFARLGSSVRLIAPLVFAWFTFGVIQSMLRESRILKRRKIRIINDTSRTAFWPKRPGRFTSSHKRPADTRADEIDHNNRHDNHNDLRRRIGVMEATNAFI